MNNVFQFGLLLPHQLSLASISFPVFSIIPISSATLLTKLEFLIEVLLSLLIKLEIAAPDFAELLMKLDPTTEKPTPVLIIAPPLPSAEFSINVEFITLKLSILL